MFNIPLRSGGGSPKNYTENTLYNALATLFAYVFLDFDTRTSFSLRAAALKETKALAAILNDVVKETRGGNFLSLKRISEALYEDVLHDYGRHLVERLSEGGNSIDEVVATIIPTAAAAVATQAQGVGRFFLSSRSHLLTRSLACATSGLLFVR